MSPSLTELQDPIDDCSAYAEVNDNVFNGNKFYVVCSEAFQFILRACS